MAAHNDSILWFKEVDKRDTPTVGGKAANLGEMMRAGFPIPHGFIITTSAYFRFISENRLAERIKQILSTANYNHPESLLQVSHYIREEIMRGKVSPDLISLIFKAYRELSGPMDDALVAVSSSTTTGNFSDASFLGREETFFNVLGESNLLLKIKAAWASLFEADAIFYRHEKHIDHFRVGLAAVVMKMIESEKSGVMFTLDPVSNNKSRIIIEAIYGLGEFFVQGMVTPDHYEIDKHEMKIVKKYIAIQEIMLQKVNGVTKEVHLPEKEGSHQKITEEQIIKLAELGKKLERHYYFPQEIEWAIEKGQIYIIQTRAITTQSKKYEMKPMEDVKLPLILTGSPASPGIASGPVKQLLSINDLDKMQQGDVLVALQTNPDYLPAMKKATAIVTELGGRTSHAAIVSRELGIPAIVGAEKATKILQTGSIITVNGTKGEVYKGGTSSSSVSSERPIHKETIETATKVYVNLAQPNLAAQTAEKPVDGIGLLQSEFMISDIGIHPKRLVHEEKKHVFIEKMTEGLLSFCTAFNPRPVIYRASDFKTNEYRNLIGGSEFEPVESNPLLGYRGAYRYIHDPEVFELEIEAIKIVREQHGLKNLWMMLPFVRNVHELRQVKKILTANDLHRSPTFKLWMMMQTPANVILLDKFIEEGIDGISIGSNDLTTLILGTDRDNSEVAPEYDEQSEAVLWAFEHVIKTANKYGITTSFCGQAASLYPSLLEKLVDWGVTSISVASDVIERTREDIAKFEKKHAR